MKKCVMESLYLVGATCQPTSALCVEDPGKLICVLRINRTMNHAMNYAFKKMAMMNNSDGTSNMEEQNYGFLRKYFLYIKKFDPEFSREAGHKVSLYYTNVITRPGSQATPRLFDTLYNLCRAIATIKQKTTVDLEDVEEVIELYDIQLKQHLSRLVDIPCDLRDLAVEEVFKVLEKWGSKFGYEYIELLKIVCEKVEWISYFIGFNQNGKHDWSVESNYHLREIRDRLKGAAEKNDKILVLRTSPLTLAWRETYEGGNRGDVSNKYGGSENDETDEGLTNSVDNNKEQLRDNDSENQTSVSSVSSVRAEETEMQGVVEYGRSEAIFVRYCRIYDV